MITLITPTGDRQEAFALCERFIYNQTYTGDIQWIVVDDGEEETCTTHNQTYIRRIPQPREPKHTLVLNLRKALPHVRGDQIFIIEDDDYYAPNYIETMLEWLKTDNLVGELGARYYYLQDQKYYHWPHTSHASLCRTAFNKCLLPKFSTVVTNLDPKDVSVDIHFWGAVQQHKKLRQFPTESPGLCVGIKQMPGRAGSTHRPTIKAKSDSNAKMFNTWLGDDAFMYRKFVTQKSDFIHYTVQYGGYDTLQSSPHSHSVCVHDGLTRIPKGWKQVIKPNKNRTPRLNSRFYKMRPDQLYQGTKTLYTDGNLHFRKQPRDLVRYMESFNPDADIYVFQHDKRNTIEEEVQEVIRLKFAKPEQVDTNLTHRYRKLPLALGGCILRKPTEAAKRFGQIWWDYYQEGYGRDQVILTIALEKSGATYCIIDDRTALGHRSKWFRRMRHNKSRKHL